MELTIKVNRVTDINDKDFLKALKIYHEQVSDKVRTDENQIKAYITDNIKTKAREMAFYVLYAKKQVIGYAEVGILFSSKTFFVDYFILGSSYQNKGYFYSCYNLMIEDLKSQYPTFRYIIVEYYNSTKNNDSESFARKCLALEYYKVIDIKYFQPGLFEEGDDTIVPCWLLIQETSKEIEYEYISKELFEKILKDIYFNHYVEWYEHFFDNYAMENYKNKLNALYTKIISNTYGTIKLTDYSYVNCKYSAGNKCAFTRNAPFSKTPKMNNKTFIILSFLTIVSVIVLAIALFALLGHVLHISTSAISVIVSLVVGIISIAGTLFNMKMSFK